MKDYKEKYEQLTKFIKDLYPFMSDYCKEKTEGMIPEFKESEDERIRKSLIEHIKGITSWNYFLGISKEQMLAWLEKQGEFKPIFRVGDYIRNKKTKDRVLIEQIDIANKVYCYVSRDDAAEIHSDFRFSEQNDWEIIGQKIVEQKPNFCHHEVDFSNCSEEYRKAYYDGWSNCNQQHAQLKAEQKSVEWSEEDEKLLKLSLDNLTELQKRFGAGYGKVGDCISWLKSLRPQPKQEWSKEDEIGLGDALWAIEQAKTIAKNENDMGNIYHAEKWLKSLRLQHYWKPSKEQMRTLKYCINALNCNKYEEILFGLYEQLKTL